MPTSPPRPRSCTTTSGYNRASLNRKERNQRMIKHWLVIMVALGLAAAPAAQAQVSDGVIKIGVLTDMSSLYADLSGQGSVIAARMAVEDFGAAKKGMKVEIVSADHQNKPDVGSAIARQWYDVDRVDAIFDVPNSGVALAVNQITRDKGKALIVSGAASADLTGKACSPNTVHWTYDTWMLANGTGNAIVKTGGDSWFFLTADYAFGHTTNAIKQAAEFGIVKGGQNLAGLLVFITDVHGLGLNNAQGLILTESFYWDYNDQTRAFAKRFAAADRGIHPTMVHAGVYAGVLHYLKAVEAMKSDDGTKVIQKMKEIPTDDPLFGKGRIRQDGRKVHPAYLLEVKKPSESKYPWDYYKIRATIPADQAFRPEKEGGCSLVK